jgi:hypothetical protein
VQLEASRLIADSPHVLTLTTSNWHRHTPGYISHPKDHDLRYQLEKVRREHPVLGLIRQDPVTKSQFFRTCSTSLGESIASQADHWHWAIRLAHSLKLCSQIDMRHPECVVDRKRRLSLSPETYPRVADLRLSTNNDVRGYAMHLNNLVFTRATSY